MPAMSETTWMKSNRKDAEMTETKNESKRTRSQEVAVDGGGPAQGAACA